MSTIPIETESIPVKWSNIISTMSAGSRSGMHFSDSNNSVSHNYHEKVSNKLFTYLPNNNAIFESNGKKLQLNIVPYNNINGAFSYISKNRKFCENCRRVETNPKSTKTVAISHEPRNDPNTISTNLTKLFNTKYPVDGNKYDFQSNSVPLQNLTKTDVFNDSSNELLNCLDCSNSKNCSATEIQVCLKCLKIFKKVCSIKQKGNMSRSLKDTSASSLTRSNSVEKRKPFQRPFTKNRFEPTGSSRMASPTPQDSSLLLRQNQDLRQRLQEEASSYRRRLDTYKQAQQNQAALVGRLQSKVLQYKQKCNDLEGKIHDVLPVTPRITPPCSSSQPLSSSAIPLPPPPCYSTSAPLSLPCPSSLEQSTQPTRGDYRSDDNDDIIRRLEDEKYRCEQLLTHNNLLRQQLEESHRTNEALTNDLQKLTTDWEHLRDDIISKEDEWKEEEQTEEVIEKILYLSPKEAFNEYYNSEHNRLLNMWRDVVSVKRLFRDMQISVKSELGRMRNDISGANREVAGACGGVSVNIRNALRVEEAQQVQTDRVCIDLRTQIANLKSQYEDSRHEIAQREQRLQDLMIEMKNIEDRCMQAENQASQINRLNDEIERLNVALRDIAHVVVQDAETSGEPETTIEHLHLSQASIVPPRSPKRGGVRTSQAFAEGTISAVQAALHKYQLMLHDVQVKLQSNKDALQATKKQFDTSEHARDILTGKVTELTDKLDSTNFQLAELCKERDSLQKTLDDIRGDKQSAERGKAELSSIVDGLNTDYEKLQNANSKIQKLADSLDEEKKFLELELQRVIKDKEIIEISLRAEEERGSRMREETITLREEINKLYLSRDLLEQQRLESDGMLSIVEKQKMELEFDFDRLSAERSDLLCQLEKANSSNDNVTTEVKELHSIIVELETERNTLKTQTADQIADLAALKKELITAEQTRLDLESEKLSISEKLKFLEIDKEKVEQELSQVIRERGDVSNQLTAITRKKEQIGEELMRLRQRLEQSNETNNRLNRSLEDLVKENEEKLVIIEGNEKEIQRLQEQLASIRTEKEALEASLFDTNTTLETTDNRKNQLEREVQDLLIKHENMKSTIQRLTKDLETCDRRAQEMKTNLTNAANIQESEFLQKIAQLKSLGEDNIRKLNEEKEQIRASLEKRMQHALQAMETAKDCEFEALRERYETLRLHLDSICQQHEEVLIRAENDKQQSLLIAHRDKQAVAEKLDQVMRELTTENENMERLRREAAARCEKDRASINQLRDEMAKLKARLEEQRVKSEEQVNKLEIFLNSMREERDTAQHEVENLKVQVRLSEDKGDAINLQLQETLRKLKENEILTEGVRKELTDNRRSLADSNIERDKYANTNKELREHVKRVEGQRREQSRHLEDSLQKIASLEESKNSLENERTRLSTVLKETQNNLTKLTQEYQTSQNSLQKVQQNSGQKDVLEKELQSRLSNETEERERVQLELHQVKKQMSDLDANLQATRHELGRARCKANQDEHRWHNREQELLGRMEEGRGREKRLEDQKHNLEVCLADATQQIQELKARLGGAEGRVRALDDQLAHTDGVKRDAENRLSSIGHTLRRIAGIQLDGTVSLPYRLLSPSRRYSPARGGHDYDNRSVTGDGPIIDVDPEMVRKGVRTLMQQVAHIEREKDDYKAQLCTAKKQLHEASEQHGRSENKISKLQQTLRAVQEDKANTETKLTQKSSLLTNVEESLKQKTDEVNNLREKVTSLELQLGSGAEERGQCEDRLEKCRHTCARLESEKRHLQEELARCDGRASKLDLQRVALEGDIQRLQMALQEKDCNIRNLQERLDNQCRASAQLEDRCVALKTTVDQLKERLQSAAITETELRGELNCLQKERSEQGHNVQAGQDKVKQIQKLLSTSENERRILAERLDAAQNSLNDVRRSQQSQQDINQRHQDQIAELEVQKSALESQLRIAKWNQDNSDQLGGHSTDEELNRQLLAIQRERNELKAKVDALNDKLRYADADKRSKFSGNVQFDRSEKGGEYDSNRMETESLMSRGGGAGHMSLNTNFNCGLDHSIIEQENRDLRMKVRRMETALAEKESELARAKAKLFESPKCLPGDSERYRSAQLQAERLLDAREQSHRQQVLRLENQISMLREQLAQEAKRRQMYILRSSRVGREMHQLRQTLGDSLRHVAQEPLDPGLLESETRRLDSAVSMSLPPTTARDYDRSISPRSYK